MIAIIGAMQPEIDALKSKIEIIEEQEYLHTKFYIGKYLDKEVVLLLSGIGKVSSAVATSLLFQNFDIDYVINLGSAGGVKEGANVGDLVVSTDVVYHDVDATGFDHPYGKVPNMPKLYHPNEYLKETVIKALDSIHLPYHLGIIASGDSFITDYEMIKAREKRLELEVIAVEMEAASIAQTCFLYEKPFIILRSLSDVVGNENQEFDFLKYLEIASENSAKLVLEVLKNI